MKGRIENYGFPGEKFEPGITAAIELGDGSDETADFFQRFDDSTLEVALAVIEAGLDCLDWNAKRLSVSDAIRCSLSLKMPGGLYKKAISEDFTDELFHASKVTITTFRPDGSVQSIRHANIISGITFAEGDETREVIFHLNSFYAAVPGVFKQILFFSRDELSSELASRRQARS